MRRTLVLVFTLAVLWAVFAQLNQLAGRINLSLFVGGLFVAYPALALPLGSGLAATVLGGFILDANAPVPFGTHAVFLAAAHLVIFNLRGRLPREETNVRLFVALAANLGLFLFISAVALRRIHAPAAVSLSLAANLAASELALALIGPWFFAFQERALFFAGAQPQWRL